MVRILVFAADPLVRTVLRNVLREVLQQEGYDVVEADNTYEAIPPAQPAPTGRAWPDAAYLIAF